MQYREIGKSGIKASAIGLGCWAIGGGGFWDGTDDDAQARKAILYALEHGVTLIDTAPGYGDGKSEALVGDVIKDLCRKEIVVSTKCGIVWWGDQGGYMHTLDGKRYYRNLEPDSMRSEVEKSLKRLNTEYIDVLFTHWPSLESFPTPIERTMRGLIEMKRDGLIRAIGASNVNVEQMKEYMDVGQLDVTQPPYSMLNREIEGEFLDYCTSNLISVFAYSPLEQGLLTGRITMDYEPKPGTYRANYLSWYQKSNRIQVIKMLDGWADLLDKYNCTASQLVIAWTIMQKGITHALCGARKVEHIKENIVGGSVDLAQSDELRMRGDIENLKIAD